LIAAECEAVNPPSIFSQLGYRFGYDAQIKYGGKYPERDANFETHLAEEWRATILARRQKWEQDRDAIRYGWNFNAEISKGALKDKIGTATSG
jgi:hypothetical protein